MKNLKIGDHSIDQIVQKVRKAPKNNNESLVRRYADEQQQKQADSRIKNCQLQDHNLQLRKQLKKLQSILNVQDKQKLKIQTTNSQIIQVKQKLRAVLNISQTLEQSLVKIRITQRSKKSYSNVNSIIQSQCCCSRNKSRKQIKAAPVSPVKNKTKIEQKVGQNSSLHQNSKNKNFDEIQNKLQIKHAQIQCNQLNQKQQLQQIKQKKKHIDKLNQIIKSQNNVIRQYQVSIHSNGNVGKITKASALKKTQKTTTANLQKANTFLRTCTSVGSIIKTNKLIK